jgi:hypothetical protein
VVRLQRQALGDHGNRGVAIFDTPDEPALSRRHGTSAHYGLMGANAFGWKPPSQEKEYNKGLFRRAHGATTSS